MYYENPKPHYPFKFVYIINTKGTHGERIGAWRRRYRQRRAIHQRRSHPATQVHRRLSA